MLSTTFVSLLATAALALPAPLEQRAFGTASVVNNCQDTFYLWSIANDEPPSHTLAPSGTYSEDYRSGPNGGGISLKIGRTDDLYVKQPLEQLEYKIADHVYYDLSEVDGQPIEPNSVLLHPSQFVGPTCVDVDSSGAYHMPDDMATKACDLGTSLTLTLCA